MRFRIELVVETDKATGALQFRMRRIGRVPRGFGGLAAGMYFAISETLRNYIKQIGGKPDVAQTEQSV